MHFVVSPLDASNLQTQALKRNPYSWDKLMFMLCLHGLWVQPDGRYSPFFPQELLEIEAELRKVAAELRELRRG